MSELFNPETLKDEYHQAFNKCLEQGMYTFEAKARLSLTRKSHPKAYMALAALAQEYGCAAFRLGADLILEHILRR